MDNRGGESKKKKKNLQSAVIVEDCYMLWNNREKLSCFCTDRDL